MASHLWAFLVGMVTLLAAVAAFSRIVTMPDAPKVVTGAANTLTRLFNGAFGY